MVAYTLLSCVCQLYAALSVALEGAHDQNSATVSWDGHETALAAAHRVRGREGSISL